MSATQLLWMKYLLVIGAVDTLITCITIIFFREKLKNKIIRLLVVISGLILLIVIIFGVVTLIYYMKPAKDVANPSNTTAVANNILPSPTATAGGGTQITPTGKTAVLATPAPPNAVTNPNAQILNYKLVASTKSATNLGNKVAYSIKNISTKGIENCKVAIFIYDKDKKPVQANTKSTGYAVNMIEETSFPVPENPVVIKPGLVLNPSEVKDSISDSTLSDEVKYVKMIITQIKYAGETQVWYNPETEDVIKNSSKF